MNFGKIACSGRSACSPIPDSAANDRAETQRNAGLAMHLLIDQEAIVIPVAGLFRLYGMKDTVQGFNPHPSQTNQWWNTVWMSK